MRVLYLIFYIISLSLVLAGNAAAGSTEKEILLDALDDRSLNLQNLNPMRMPGKSYDDRARQTIITGYAVTSFRYNDFGVGHHGLGNELHFGQDAPDTHDFAFNVMEVGFTKRYSDYAWVAAALEVGLHRGHTGETETATELDAGEIHLVAPVGNGIDFTLGKFNSPVSFEQEDAPLLLQASHSLAFQYASPAKMAGLMATYPILENLDVRAIVYNGWNKDADNNDAKSAAFQVGFAPTQWLDTKFSFLWGPELKDEEQLDREVYDFVATLTPFERFILGLELAYGSDEGQSLTHPGQDADWFAGQVTLHYDYCKCGGLTFRYSWFDEMDGRADMFEDLDEDFFQNQARTRQEITVASLFHISPEFLGYMGFGVIPKTRHLISGVDLRLEYRYDWSDEPVDGAFFENSFDVHKRFRNSFIAELVASF